MAHEAGPQTVKDVADAVRGGLRSLQERLRKHRPVSPRDDIKQVCLALMRTELLGLAQHGCLDPVQFLPQ